MSIQCQPVSLTPFKMQTNSLLFQKLKRLFLKTFKGKGYKGVDHFNLYHSSYKTTLYNEKLIAFHCYLTILASDLSKGTLSLFVHC
jgi:hypothetical protein